MCRVAKHVKKECMAELLDREEFQNKNVKSTGNESNQQWLGNGNKTFFHKWPSRPAPSLASAPAPRPKTDHRV
ncbi:hypothetical protein H5410_022651 [Solanum commersonii]|uniref:Uncharacterized protein n=1 Tax=Solanum commersonii TaxID=4109 RepID=A0A9J5ZFE3_SOLCO|nr:hypothetical protein H5410_022651 [Solanum commersonii]